MDAERRNQLAFYADEDEIDLIELFKVVKKRQIIIYITTFLFLLLSFIYIAIKTPLYEVKANIRIGSIGDRLLIDTDTLHKTLQTVFHVEESYLKSEELKKSGAYIETISKPRNIKGFIEIKILGLSNKKAIEKAKEIIQYTQEKCKPKIDAYILKTKNEIYQLQTRKTNIQKITIPNLQTQITLINKQKIPEIQSQIAFYKTYKLQDINNQEAFYKQKLEIFNQAIKQLYSQFDKTNEVQIMIASIQMINYQDLIIRLQDKIKNLELEKMKIKVETIPNLLHQKNNLKEIEIKKIKDEIIEQKNLIKQIDNKIKLLQYNISSAYIQNSKLLGGFVTKKHPVKPKKVLIIIVSLITGFIVSLFLIFLIEFIEANKKELNTKT